MISLSSCALSCALVLFSACVVSASLVRRWDANANFHSPSSHHTFVLKHDSTRQGHSVAAAAFEAAIEHSARQPPWQSASVDAGTFDIATDANRGWLRAQIPAHAADIASHDPVVFYFHRQRSSWHKYLTMTQDGIARFIAKRLSRAADSKPSNAASALLQPKQHSVEQTLAVRAHIFCLKPRRPHLLSAHASFVTPFFFEPESVYGVTRIQSCASIGAHHRA
jgi:hypothetical protein